MSVDLSKYFDTLNHELLMTLLHRQIQDMRVLRLIWKTFYNVELPKIYTNSTPMRHGKAWICVELYERVKVEIRRYYGNI